MSKKILIFGGTGAIGFSIAKKIIKEGYTPILVSRNEEELVNKSKEINCEYEICDVLEQDQIDLISKKHADTVNGLAYCAGSINLKPLKIAKDIGLEDYLEVKSEFLAYGLQRQLELGIAIACNPKLLLLDEPTAGMSPAETKEIINLIKKLSKYYSILIVEHDMEVIYNLANNIYVLDRGKIIFEGAPNTVKKSELVQKVYLGL